MGNLFFTVFQLFLLFLAHLSQRFIGELIVYQWSIVRCRRTFTFSNIFFSKTALPIKAKFYVEPPWEGGKKVYINGPGHITKMAAMLKTLKNLLLQNHWANCIENWHVASRSVVLQSLYKLWPLVDLDLFYGKVNFGSMGIWMEKLKCFIFVLLLFS